MKDTKFRILLDIHEVRSQATIPVKVGDVSCKIYITLVEGGKPYKIHENSFGVFTGKKGDKKYLFNNCVIENGIIRYDFTPQTVAAAGVLECEIRIYDEDGGVLTTPSFNIVVDERAVNDSELASTTEFTFLDEIIVNEGQRMENERNRIEAFNNMGLSVEDKGDYYILTKTNKDGSKEEFPIGKGEDYVITPEDYKAIADKVVTDTLDAQAAEYFDNLDAQATEHLENIDKNIDGIIDGKVSVVETATGSAITIESSQAPIPYLKLSGKTTQDETTLDLSSVGDSGSFEVYFNNTNMFAIGDKSEYFTTYNEGLYIGSNVGSLVSDLDFTINGDTISFNSYSTSNYPWLSKWLNLRKNTLYTFYRKQSGSNIRIVGINSKATGKMGTMIAYYAQNDTGAKEFNSGDYDYYFVSIYPFGANNKVVELQINYGSTLLEYERGVSLPSLTMPYTLRSVGDIKDEVDFNKGVFIQRITKRVLTENDNWQDMGAFGLDDFWNRKGGYVYNFNNDRLPNKLEAQSLAGTTYALGFNGAIQYKNYMYVSLPESIVPKGDVTAFKTWIASNNITIIYELATPIETPLTETELNAYRQLMTNKGNTTILSEADMEVDYYINKPNAQAIGSLHEQINKDYFKLQQAIISTGGN